MNYSKIRILMRERKLTRQDMAYRLGITPHGFDYMLENQSMKVDIIEKISKILNVPITYWFTENMEVNLEQNSPEAVVPDKELLVEQLKIKDRQIDFLQQQIEYMKEKSKK